MKSLCLKPKWAFFLGVVVVTLITSIAYGARGDKIDIGAHQTDLPGWTSVKWVEKMQSLVSAAPLATETTTWPTIAAEEWAVTNNSDSVAIQFRPITETAESAWTTQMPIESGSYTFRMVQLVPPEDPNVVWLFDMFPEDYGTLTITKSIVTVTANATKITYGQSLAASNLVQITNVAGVFTWDNPNLYPEVGSNAEYGWYFTPSQSTIAPVYGKAKVTVDPAPLTISALNSTSVYGAEPQFSSVPTGFVRGETAQGLGLSITVNSSASATANVGKYELTPVATPALKNYVIKYVLGEHIITPAPILASNITINVANETTYSGAPVVATASYPAMVTGSIVYSQNGVVLTSAPVNVGTYRASVTLSSNYKYANASTAQKEFKILPATPLLNVATTPVVYGDAVKSSLLTYSGSNIGRILWSATDANMIPNCVDSTKTYAWEFTSTNPNYTNTAGSSKIEVNPRKAIIKPKDLLIPEGTVIDDVLAMCEPVITNMLSPDVVENMVFNTTYTPSLTKDETATISIVSLDTSKAPNHVFEIQTGVAYVGTPPSRLNLLPYVATAPYGTKLKDIPLPFTTNNPTATIRWSAIQENLMPSVVGESYTAELVYKGFVINSQEATINTRRKDATLKVVCDATIPYGSTKINAAVTATGFISDADIPAYSVTQGTYSSTSPVSSMHLVNIDGVSPQTGNYLINRIGVAVKVVSRELSNMVAIQTAQPIFDGSAHPVDFAIALDGKKLVKNVDYTVTPSTLVEPGATDVTINYIGNYSGSQVASYSVAQNNNIVASMNVAPQIYGNKNSVIPAFTYNGINAHFVTAADYEVTFTTENGIENITPVEVGKYKVTLKPNGVRVNFAPVTMPYEIVPKPMTFVVQNNVHYFDEITPNIAYRASVTPVDRNLIPANYKVTYGEGAKASDSQTAIGNYPIFVEIKDKNYSIDSTIALPTQLQVKQLLYPEVYFATSTPKNSTLKEIQQELGSGEFVYLAAQASGPISGQMIVNLNMLGTAVKGVNYDILDKNGNVMSTPSFSFMEGNRVDSIKLITKDDRVRTPDLNIQLDLIAPNANALIRPAGMTVRAVVEDLKNPVSVSKIAFSSVQPIEMLTRDGGAKMAILADPQTQYVYVSVSGAKVGTDVQLYDSKGIAVETTSKGSRVPVELGYAGFTVELKDINFVPVGKNKPISVIIKSADVTTGIVNIDHSKKKQIINFTNDAPIAFPDELGIDPESAIDGFELLVLHNDVKFEKYATPLYVRGVRNVGEKQFSSEITTKQFGVVQLKSDGRLVYIMPAHYSSAGYKDTFEYEVAQDGGGVSNAIVTVTVGERHIKTSVISVIPPENIVQTDKKPVASGNYLDALSSKASSRKRQKKLAISAKWEEPTIAGNVVANYNDSNPLLLSIKSNVKGVNKRELNKAYKAGCFLADMRRVDSTGNFFYEPEQVAKMVLKDNITADEVNRKLVQVKYVGINVLLKGYDSQLTTVNVAGAESIRLADSSYSTDVNGDSVPAIMPIYYKTDASGKKLPIYITLTGDLFGSAPKFYLEYKSTTRNSIKKLSLPRTRSISFVDDNGVKRKVKRLKENIKPGKGSQEWVKWSHKNIQKLLDLGVERFDLVIDNGSLLGVKDHFEVKEINKPL